MNLTKLKNLGFIKFTRKGRKLVKYAFGMNKVSECKVKGLDNYYGLTDEVMILVNGVLHYKVIFPKIGETERLVPVGDITYLKEL